MPQQWPAADIARTILDGFDNYREHFRQITDGARARFEGARWQDAQAASAARINLYEEKVAEVNARLRAGFEADALLDVGIWPLVKSAYISLIDLRFDDELAETWYNSAFCSLFSHDLISDGCMFIHTTRPSLRRSRTAQTIARKANWRACSNRSSPTIASAKTTPTCLAICSGSICNCAKACRTGCARTRNSASSCFPRCSIATRVPTWWAASIPTKSSGRW